MNCPICGAVLNEGAKFCGNCGNKLEAAPVAAAVETPAAPVQSAVPTELPSIFDTAAQSVTPVQSAAPTEQPSIFDTPVQSAIPTEQPSIFDTSVQSPAPAQSAAPVEQPSIFDQPAQPAQTAFAQQPAMQQTAYVQPAAQQTAYAQPAAGGGYGGNNYIQNNYTQENANPPQVKKKGKGVLVVVLVILALLVVGLGVALFVFRGSLKNFWARLTKSPDEYLKYVISENMEEHLDAMEEAQKEYMDILAKMDDINMQGGLRVEIDDEILDMIEDAAGAFLANSRYGSSAAYSDDYYDYFDDYYDTDMYDKYDTYDDYYQAEHGSKSSGGADMNLSAYGDIGIVGSYDRKGNLLGLNAGVQVKGGSDVLGVDAVFDGDNYTVYGRIPQLNKDYLMIDLSKIMDKNNQKKVDKVLSATADLSAVSMDSKMLRSMYKRYAEAVLDPVKDVKASKVKLPVNDTKMSCRAYEFDLDDGLFKDIVLSVMDEIANDKDLQKWFEDYLDSLDLGAGMTKPDWDTLLDQIDEAEKEVKNISFDEEFKCTFYITNEGKITGFSMLGKEEKDPHFSFAWNLDGTKLDVELTSDLTDKNDKTQFMDIKGGGSVKKGKFSGDFSLDLSVLDDKVEFSLEDVEVLDKKNPSGTFRIGIEQFMTMAGAAADDIPDSIKKSELVVSVAGTIKDRTFSIGLENGSGNMIKFTADSKVSASQGVAVPSSKESVEIDEKNADTAMVEYLKNSDIEKLVSALETLGLPDSYADQVRQVTKMLEYY
ncbi:MAG: hypothetical protein K5686_02685 [Lachnospiraceae bacterium]|nr:hypothetical protein [Lachnospiraceae bacterium]